MRLKILVNLALLVNCFAIVSAQQEIKTVADFEAQGAVAQRNGNCDEAALGQVYAMLGDNTGAMQPYYILQTLNLRLAAMLLQQIPK